MNTRSISQRSSVNYPERGERNIRDNSPIPQEILYGLDSWPDSLREKFYSFWESIDSTNIYFKIFVALDKLYTNTRNPKHQKLVEELKLAQCLRSVPIYSSSGYSAASDTFNEDCEAKYEIRNRAKPKKLVEGLKHEQHLNSEPPHYIAECIAASNTSNEDYEGKYKKHNQSTNSTSYLKLCVFIVIFMVLLYFWYHSESNKKGIGKIESNKKGKPEKIEEWERNIRGLQKQFPSQNDIMWSHILSGVKTTVTERPVKPSVFLLLYEDKRTSNCLASKVGKEAVKLLGESSQEPIVVKGEDLKINKSLIEDYGLFMETYKHDIERKHVMIVLDLQEIPAVVAQTFHTLCDVENPLVSNAAFLFTMQINENEKQKPTIIAEKYLKILWKDSLEVDIMDPLITRVTNAVLLVKLEADLPC